MLEFLFHSRLQRALARLAGHPLLPLAMAGIAFALTLSMSLPVTAGLVPAVLLAPRRWPWISVAGAFGSAVGAALLLLLFHHLGWVQIHAAFPQMEAAPDWQRVIRWTARYGVIALAFVAATPLPQTPALILCAVSDQAFLEVVLAVFAGKLVKYGVVGWAAARFPTRFAFVRRWVESSRAPPPRGP